MSPKSRILRFTSPYTIIYERQGGKKGGLLSCTTHTMLGRLNVCLKTTQLTSPSACTTSSFTLAVAVAVSAITGTAGKFSLSTFRPCSARKRLICVVFVAFDD